jgi:hypothetical protein
MSDYETRPLNPATWDAFVQLAQRHNGVWGGCWCTWFHPPSAEKGVSSEGNRAYKERLVREGNAHAALVFDGDVAVAWCQYGSPTELPSIYHLKEYIAGLDTLPDYRITCFFVDKDYRRTGVAGVALRGALDLIAKAGGGVVEAYPQDTWQENVGLLPLQRHAPHLRECRLHLRPSKGQEPHGDAQDGLLQLGHGATASARRVRRADNSANRGRLRPPDPRRPTSRERQPGG